MLSFKLDITFADNMICLLTAYKLRLQLKTKHPLYLKRFKFNSDYASKNVRFYFKINLLNQLYSWIDLRFKIISKVYFAFFDAFVLTKIVRINRIIKYL